MATVTRVARKPPLPFPIIPPTLPPDLDKWAQGLKTYCEKLEESLRLPPHTARVDQFLRHDATGEKLTWQTLPGLPLLAGKIGIDPSVSTNAWVNTSLVTSTCIILCSVLDATPDLSYADVDFRTNGVGFMVKESGFTAPHYVGYLLYEPTATTLYGSSGTCPQVKTLVINGSASYANGTTKLLTWDSGMSRWHLASGGVWDLYYDGTKWLMDTPGPDKFTTGGGSVCPPNTVWTQCGTGNVGATGTIT